MKFLVFSDSHGDFCTMQSVCLSHQRDCDGVLFLGDGLRDLAALKSEFPALPVIAVAGNCDIGAEAAGISPLELRTFENKRLLLCHGHLYHVKYGCDNLLYAAQEQNADIVLFGHTHRPLYQYMRPGADGMTERAIHLCNPGSVRQGRYGILDIGDFGVMFNCVDLNR